VELIARSAKRRTPGKSVGDHPADGKPILLKAGRYGAYLEHNKVRATVPKDLDPDALSLEQAMAVLAAKAGGTGKTKATAAKPAKARTAAERGKAGAKAPATGAGAGKTSTRGDGKTGAKTPAGAKAKLKVPQG
jgi:DNA topoisomerase-1